MKVRSELLTTGNALDPLPGWRSLVRLLSRGPVLACADQAVVSATSFLTLILVARWNGAEQLGLFAIGLSVVGVTLAVQHSLVSLPYAVQRHRPPGSAGEHAYCCLLHSGLFSASVAGLLVLAALGLSAAGAHPESVHTAWALAALMPLAATKEFAREFALARLDWHRALVVDLVAAAIQLSAIVWLGLAGLLSPFTAYAAMGVSCGLAALGWLCLSRSDFAFRLGQLRTTLRQNWELGKWLFLSRSALLVQGYSTYWLSMFLAGAAATGVYAACMSIVAFANPVLLGLYNFLVPNAVLAWKDGGTAGLRKRAAGDALLLGAALGCFFVLVLFAGEQVMQLLYPGEAFEGHGLTLAVLTLGTLIAGLAIPASNALTSMERPRPLAAIAGVSAILNVALVWWLIGEWGLLGAAIGIVAANLVGMLGRWAIFLALTRSPSNPVPTAPQEQ
ncbi:MAG TPA: lipopolysaccharide biosynthesis protein [Afifellaceae bacterium]|nr:lipopolysaccharide biosynthesis protein [Afifellaceae bacterium]